MKLKNIFTALVASLTVVVGCDVMSFGDDFNKDFLDEVQVSTSYVALPIAGGSKTITVKAVDNWEIDTTGTSKWLTVSPVKGGAGESTVTFTAVPSTDTKEAELTIACAGATQVINVLQQAEKADLPISPVATVLKGTEGKTYRVSGAVTKIAETVKYGNWYLADETGEVYIYGTKYNGQTEQAALEKLGIEVGDVLTVEGPMKNYNGTIELVDVDIIKIVKSLLKVEPVDFEVAKEGEIVEVVAKYKGNDLKVSPQVDWISLADINVGKDSTIIKLNVAPNEGDVRVGEVKISSSITGQNTEQVVTITQASGLDCYALPYAETFSANQGAWTIEGDIPAGLSYVWTWGGANYGMKATAYLSSTKTNFASCVSLVSPRLDLTSAKNVTLQFDQVQRYAGNVDEDLTLWVSTDNGATWNQVLIPEYTTGKDWNFITTAVSLDKFVGNQAIIKFQYKSTDKAAATWEIKNLSVKEGEVEIANIAQLNGTAVSAEKEFTANLTDAVVVYVNGGNAFIQDKTAGIQLYKSGHGLKAGQVINGKVTGKLKIYNGYAEATALDISAATVTDGDAPKPTVKKISELLGAYLRWQNCLVKLENVTFATAITTSNRNGKITQDGAEIAVYAQVKNTLEMNGTGNLVCLPTRYNTTLQVGVFSNDDWTPAN